MNHQLWNSVAAKVVALAFVAAGATACGERMSDVSTSSAGSANPSSSAQVAGTPPAAPTTQNDTAQTTSPAGAKSEVSQSSENTQRPLEGDVNSFSTLSPTTPQKAKNVSTVDTPERKAQ
jgi:hypothetical protein